MATYKVPSDLDVEDKVIGFLSLKQFIFVLVDCGLIFLAYELTINVSWILIIPLLPFIFVLSVLGLYHRSDQPVEVFLISWLKFKTSPKVRHWQQGTFTQDVQIEKPTEEQFDYSKGMNRDTVHNRLSKISGQLDDNSWGLKSAQGIQPIVITGYKPGEERILTKQETEGIEAQKDASWQHIIQNAKPKEDLQKIYVPLTQEADGSYSPISTGTPIIINQIDPRPTNGEIDLNEGAEFNL